MPSLTIKNVPDEVYARLKDRAQRNHRSLNSEVIHCLEQATGGMPEDPEALLARVRAVRERGRLPYRTPDELRAWRERGRA